MADWFVDSTVGGGAGTGADWANAYTTLAAAFAAKSAGDRFFVAHDHAESGASLTLTCPGTIVAPCVVLCVTAGSTPAAGDIINAKGGGVAAATFESTTTSTLTIAGLAHWQGFNFHGGQVASATGGSISFQGSGLSTFKDCHFANKTTGGSSGPSPGSSSTRYTKWINCSVEFGANTQAITVAGGRFEWFDTDNAFVGVDPANGLFSANGAGKIIVSGVDLSAINTSTTEYFGAANSMCDALFYNCELSATPTLKVVQLTSPTCRVNMVNCHSSGNYIHESHQYQGKQEIETTIIRTGGASDGTQGISWKITPTANNEIVAPFECLPIVLWNDVEDVSRTVVVEGTWSDGAVPNNTDIWMDIEYLGDASTPRGHRVTTGRATPLTSSSNYSASLEAWGGAGTEFYMTAPFTPAQKGPVTIRIYVGKASETFYICPKASIANT
jgi:hypothetical protein